MRDGGRERARGSWGDVSLDHVRLNISPSINFHPKSYSICFEFVLFWGGGGMGVRGSSHGPIEWNE